MRGEGERTQRGGEEEKVSFPTKMPPGGTGLYNSKLLSPFIRRRVIQTASQCVLTTTHTQPPHNYACMYVHLYLHAHSHTHAHDICLSVIATDCLSVSLCKSTHTKELAAL